MGSVDAGDVNAGLRFEGRIGENFKLTSGTWVRAAAMQSEVLGALNGLAQDVVLVGEGRGVVGVLIVPSAALRRGGARGGGVGRGSAARIGRALVMAEPVLMADGEVTAKWNLNFAKAQARSAGLVDRLVRAGLGWFWWRRVDGVHLLMGPSGRRRLRGGRSRWRI
jgi:feruloyl-CoA synthase